MRYARLFLASFLLLISFQKLVAQNRSVFDLRGKNFEEPVRLNGTWDFHWMKLIESSKGLRPSMNKVEVPHDWATETIDNEILTSTGYTTYSVRLLVDKDRPPIGIYIPHAFSSYKLIVNDSLVWTSGEVGTTKEEYRGFREPKIVSLREFKTGTLDVLIQVANFDHHNAGLYFPLEVGIYDNLIRTVRTNQGISLFLAGGFFITGIVLLAFSTVYRHLSLPIPFYAFFSLSMMYRMIGTDYYPLHAMFNDFNFNLALCIEYLSAYSAAMFGGLFIFFMYPNQTPKWTKWSFITVTFIYMLLTVFTDSLFFTSILRYYLIFILVYIVFFILIILKAKKEDEPTSDYLIITVAVVFLWALFQTLSFLNITDPYYELRVILMGSIIILCNLALFRTFVLRINIVKQAEADFEYQKSRQTMLSLISHEIKMPIASLQMNMEMLKMSSERPEKFEKVKDKIVGLSLNAVETIKRMLHDFIYFMSLDQKSNDLLSFDDIKCFISDNWSLKLFANASIDMDLKKYPTDKLTLKYILNTVVGNAEKYTRNIDKPVEIHLGGEANEIMIEVRDFGVGMSDEQLAKMGTEQAKIDENQEITGMGFYLAKELAQRLGHDLSITSRGSDGTSVFIRITV
ncbi:sensor histidine kinase [Roseivirga sp. E12]|uniref:sensor histidine kinase n=1 Tax=Roseivirga sp. E12 TaxID=2819237 RepID=UPI001ABD3837|nr:sensor histidine kinase [Roseivirga sp. E12]MBO3697197.1 hypothetical protein [Roseivirga sp. E12]